MDNERFPGLLSSVLDNNVDRNYQGDVTFSPDKEYIVFNLDSYAKDREEHKLLVYDKNLDLIWEKEFSHPSEDRLFDLVRVKIDNNGTAYILGRVFHEKRRTKSGGEVNYHYELFKISEEKTERTELNPGGHYVRSLDLIFDNNKLVCIGTFSTENDNKLIGSAFFSIDKQSMELLTTNFQEFSSDVMFDKYGDANESQKRLKKYYIDNIRKSNDGGYVITAEEFDIDFNHGQYGGSTTYHFDDILVLRLSESGDLFWARNINKKQSSGFFDRVLSYSALVKGNNVYLFLNAHKNMGKLSEDRERFKSGLLGNINKNNSNLYVIRFDENGNWDSSIIQENKVSDVIFDVLNEEIETHDNSKIVFFGSDEQKKQFLAVEID